jgi:serine/threonine protein kinase
MTIGNYVLGEPLTVRTPQPLVFHATSATGDRVVFKCIRPTFSPDDVAHELEANRSLSLCPNVVAGFDFTEIEGYKGFFMPLCTRGDLFDYLTTSRLDENAVRTISFRVLQAVAYMHSRGFVHRDLRPENIFLSGDGPVPNAFLAGFGFTVPRPSGELLIQEVGAPPYRAPEIFQRTGYDESVDMWAFGVLLFVITTAKFPFPGQSGDREALVGAIGRGDYAVHFLREQGASDDLMDLIGCLIRVNREERPTAEQALQHRFYAPEWAQVEPTL